ncbi:Pyrimidine 5'-nucleotidase (UMPH-1) [uncultured archaeon]|nr:Pyrimidine 5'-nucleotidase (UMPH-1) [uncultured archaeon]
MENVIISDKKKLEELKDNISKQGKDKLHIISDFDGTLTNEFIAGKKVPSIISHLRSGNYLTYDYSKQAQDLYDKYHPIEIDSSIPIEERKAKMLEWWKTHFELLISSGLSKTDIEKLISDDKIKLREDTDKFLYILSKNNIPLVIMSSSGIGDAIPMVLSKTKLLFPNISIISNEFVWKEDGKAMKVKEPIIHSLNKKEIELKNYPVFEQIKDRTNVILLGNSISDTQMVEGFNYENLIKIGFLNDESEVSKEEFKKNFDVVILGDGNLEFLNDLMFEMFG